MKRETFNILSIDGGGIRGVYAAAIIDRMQDVMGLNCIDEFDLIAGTSTGAIIAAGLSIGIPASRILEMYKNQGGLIFKRPFWSGIITPKYDNTKLKQVLDEVFEDKTFSDVGTRLMVTATNISEGMPWVFKSLYNDKLSRDINVKLSDAVLASCSAPVYFNPVEHNNQLLADGGLWANNPALSALVEVLGHNIDIKKYKVRLLSIGTGITITHYPVELAEKEWGAARWGLSFIDIIFNMQSFSIEKYLSTIMNKDHYLRINFELKDNLAMDNVKIIDTLIEMGVDDFYKYKQKIMELLR